MLLFSRVATLRGGPRRIMSFAMEAREYVDEHSSLDVSLWGANFGYPLGSVAWSAIVESRAQLTAEMNALMSQDAYLDMAERGSDLWVSPAQDHLRQVIHGEPPAEPRPVGSVAGIVTATAANGRIPEVVQWGIETSEYADSITGAKTVFCADAYGSFGQVTWIIGLDDMAAADAAGDVLLSDPDYMDRIKAGGDLFIPGSGHQGLVTRLA